MTSLPSHEPVKRSITKALTYRLVVMTLDLAAVYLFTGSAKDAVGFAIASNVYTTVAYYLHERFWAHVHWGEEPAATPSDSL